MRSCGCSWALAMRSRPATRSASKRNSRVVSTCCKRATRARPRSRSGWKCPAPISRPRSLAAGLGGPAPSCPHARQDRSIRSVGRVPLRLPLCLPGRRSPCASRTRFPLSAAVPRWRRLPGAPGTGRADHDPHRRAQRVRHRLRSTRRHAGGRGARRHRVRSGDRPYLRPPGPRPQGHGQPCRHRPCRWHHRRVRPFPVGSVCRTTRAIRHCRHRDRLFRQHRLLVEAPPALCRSSAGCSGGRQTGRGIGSREVPVCGRV